MLSNVGRLFQIQAMVVRYRLHTLIPQHRASLLRWLMRLHPLAWCCPKTGTRAERLRDALIALGPIFVKFGQALSTRRDILPNDIANALATLQDKVPPFAPEAVRHALSEAYDKPLDEVFLEVDWQALASASIAQVHVVRLLDGREAVIKLLRPRICEQIQRDVRLLYFLARLVARFHPQGARLKPRQLVREFEQTLLDELDLGREAANCAQLRRNFKDDKTIYVPEIYWPYMGHNVLVMERIKGIPIANVNELKRLGTNMQRLAERGVEIFFTQVFRDSFFHADMHPGNIFVDVSDPQNPCYKAVDFGIMGTLDRQDQRYLAENLLAFFNRDYRRVAELHVESAWVPAETSIAQFESAVRCVCEPIFELPLSEISFAKVLLQLFQTASRFKMPVQPQLMLLQKTLFNVEGLGRELYPELDLWATAKPFLQNWLKQQLGMRAFLRQAQSYAPYWLEKLPLLPDLVYNNLQAQQRNQREVAESKVVSIKASLGIGVTLLLASASGSMAYSLVGWRCWPMINAGFALVGLGFVMWSVCRR